MDLKTPSSQIVVSGVVHRGGKGIYAKKLINSNITLSTKSFKQTCYTFQD